jgi:hypothetical protein
MVQKYQGLGSIWPGKVQGVDIQGLSESEHGRTRKETSIVPQALQPAIARERWMLPCVNLSQPRAAKITQVKIYASQCQQK